MSKELDAVADMLAHLICADAPTPDPEESSNWYNRNKAEKARVKCNEVSLYNRLGFPDRRPTTTYIADQTQDREFALDNRLLLGRPQDLLGTSTEIAFIGEHEVKWAGFEKLYKRPRGVWAAQTGADFYEYHSRNIRRDGTSTYTKYIAAIDKTGKPVRTVIEGCNVPSPWVEGQVLVLAASLVEDTRRPDTFMATITSGELGIRMSVAQGHHLALFALRDGPKVGNRKRPLLHEVAAHLRRTKTEPVPVAPHLRGVHEFVIDKLKVRLEA